MVFTVRPVYSVIGYFVAFFCVFCVFVVLARLSVVVQVIDWKESSPKMSCNLSTHTHTPFNGHFSR